MILQSTAKKEGITGHFVAQEKLQSHNIVHKKIERQRASERERERERIIITPEIANQIQRKMSC